MGVRQRLLSRSILDAVFRKDDGPKKSLWSWILTFFSIFSIYLERFRAELFQNLRTKEWKMDEDEYKESFRSADRKGTLMPTGDLGYSGSTFFTTPNSKFLIKSLPRRFEYDFFKSQLLQPYASHMTSHPSSLLVRITDFLHAPSISLGQFLGTAPSHHIVMENIMYGRESSAEKDKWETYDLKPGNYFFPERDIAGGALAPQSVKDRLVDEFDDKVRVSTKQREELLDILHADTELLESANAIDYSLFLIRYPVPSGQVPFLKSQTTEWRSGMRSRDGKWVYRGVILDFFWATDALQAKAMTGLIKGYNIFDQKGPMSITTTPEEYRKRFMSMVETLVEDVDAESR